MTTTPTTGQLRTAAATAARKRARLERLAPDFRASGWICTPPEAVSAVLAEADRIEDSAEDVNEHRIGGLEERDRIREHAYGMRTAVELLIKS